MGCVISGSGRAVPDRVVTNDDLARVMGTSDAWIRRRTGVAQRHLADPGVGASDLAAQAVHAALRDAAVDASEVDLLVTATMTPDRFAPGIAPLVQLKAGLGPVAAYDLRQQCSGFLYGLDLADAFLSSGRARTAVVVGAEVHSGYLPLGSGFEVLRGTRSEPDPADVAAATEARGWAVLFGDGAGAMVLRRHDDPDVGFVARRLHSDGNDFELISVPGVGFAHQPYVDAAQLEARLHWPHMNGAELFRRAAVLMPAAVRDVVADAGTSLQSLSLVVAHQANERIVEALRQALALDDVVVPSNISRYGNTTAATLPILFDEQRRDGRVGPGDEVCFTAFGAGSHWGALLYRQPGP